MDVSQGVGMCLHMGGVEGVWGGGERKGGMSLDRDKGLCGGRWMRQRQAENPPIAEVEKSVKCMIE